MHRVDPHVHTSASFDCEVAPRIVAERARRLGLGPIFITDHDTIAGALELRAAGIPTVVGEEIMTSAGELIGLFLDTAIPPGLDPQETVRRIKDQGGLAYVQHPFDTRRRALCEEALEDILEQVDVIEVFNARADPSMNARAEELCASTDAQPGAGSDAHTLRELGRCYIELGSLSPPPNSSSNCAGRELCGRVAHSKMGLRERFRRVASS